MLIKSRLAFIAGRFLCFKAVGKCLVHIQGYMLNFERPQNLIDSLRAFSLATSRRNFTCSAGVPGDPGFDGSQALRPSAYTWRTLRLKLVTSDAGIVIR
jgi:hypothetical protein